MKFKFFCFIFLNSLILRVSYGQCSYTWTPDEALPNCFLQASPALDERLNASPGSELGFSVRFTDFDTKKANSSGTTCPRGTSQSQAMSADYKIKFEIGNSNYASFESASSNINVKTVDYVTVATNIPLPCGNGTIYGSEAVRIYVKPGFKNRRFSFKVSATIQDVSTLPPGDMGNLKDNDFKFSWTVYYKDTPCPTSFSLADPTQESKWNKLFNPLTGQEDFVKYDYKCNPDLPNSNPDYEGQIITESFEMPFADDFFTMADIIAPNQIPVGITTEDGVAKYLFSSSIGVAHSFVVDDRDHFEDFHGVIGADQSLLTSIFGTRGFENGKVGFSVKQNYLCKGQKVSTQTLSKRYSPLNGALYTEVRKVH
jgi:hypothetical protein